MDKMATLTAQYDGSQFQSQEYRELLDLMDTLRSRGISRYVDLPQIIVCGDQSSGKSSVLEAISGLSFPSKENLCTRFATELILRRDPEVGRNIRIIPGHDRFGDDKTALEEFRFAQEDLDLSSVVEAAKKAMGLDGTTNNKVFSTDILRLEISGPTLPHLTMVDLPGLFLAGNKDQSDEDARMVEELVVSYMRKPRSVILAVVSAKSDFNLQQVTKHARIIDPQGIRTMGLITKPDTLDVGSESERFYVELAQNKDVIFSLGWHLLRNRDYTTRHFSTNERNQAEAEFFSQGVWLSLAPSQLGVKSLVIRLCTILYNQMVHHLPCLLEDTEASILECRDKLVKLGAPRSSTMEQRQYLLRISADFNKLMKESIDGTYTDPFFAKVENPERYRRRLRAVVQNTLLDFAYQMRRNGHAREIVEAEVVPEKPRHISRSQFIEKEVVPLMKENRGRELPGCFNPSIVGDLVRIQCKPWEAVVATLRRRVFESASAASQDVLNHIADETTATVITQVIIAPAMTQIQARMEAKVKEILWHHTSGHPITYNHYLTDNVQKAQVARYRRSIENLFKEIDSNVSSMSTSFVQQSAISNWRGFTPNALLSRLVSKTQPDMDKYSCDMAVDFMEAYYKVALKTFVDEVSVLAVEKCLIQELPQLLSTDVIFNLTDDAVQLIALESAESIAERAYTSEKLLTLQDCLTKMEKFRMRVGIDTGAQMAASPQEQNDGETDASNRKTLSPGSPDGSVFTFV